MIESMKLLDGSLTTGVSLLTGLSPERIRAIDDRVPSKAKAGRWRGAIFVDEPGTELGTWLGAAGTRGDGSSDDFHAALYARTKLASQGHNAENDKPLSTDIYNAPLLPGPEDHDRYRPKDAVHLARRLGLAIRDLVCGSLRDGHEHAADMVGFRLGIMVCADDGYETYAAIRITGSVPQGVAALILSCVPDCDQSAWFPEYALPERELLPAEQVWSDLMDPKAATQLLEEDA